MGLTKPIPPKLKEEMASDPFYARCCIRDNNCNGRVNNPEWHHNLIYAGQRQNAKFCILPVCLYHHSIEKRTDIKEKLDYIMIMRATPKDFKKFPRKDWLQRKKYLISKYG